MGTDTRKYVGMLIIAAGWLFGTFYILFYAKPDVLSAFVVKTPEDLPVFIYCGVDDMGIPYEASFIMDINTSNNDMIAVCNRTCVDLNYGNGSIQKLFFQDTYEGEVCLCSALDKCQ